MKKRKLVYSVDGKDRMVSFENRLVINSAWRIFLAILAIFYVLYNDGSQFVWIPILFFCCILFFVFLHTVMTGKYLLTYLEINPETSTVIAKANRYNTQYINEIYDIRQFEVRLKMLVIGQVSTPNYELILFYKGKKVLKQRGNLVWPRLKLKKMAEETGELLKEN